MNLDEALQRVDRAAAGHAQDEYDKRDDRATVTAKARAFHATKLAARDAVLGHALRKTYRL